MLVALFFWNSLLGKKLQMLDKKKPNGDASHLCWLCAKCVLQFIICNEMWFPAAY